jgi:hypothetical protein
MTKMWSSLAVASVVLGVMCISPHVAHAQSEALVAEIPFDFYSEIAGGTIHGKASGARPRTAEYL